MKKLLIVLITVLLVLTTAGCSADAKPEDTLNKAMESIKANEELTTTLQYFTEESVEQIKLGLAAEADNEDMKYYDMIVEWYGKLNPTLMKNLSYNVVSAEISEDGNSAVVKMEVSNMDFVPVFEAFMPEVVGYIITLVMTDPTIDFENMTPEQSEEFGMQMIVDLLDVFVETTEGLEEVDIITNEVEVSMTKSEDGSWFISDEEFYLYLLSNLEAASEEVSNGLLEGFLE